MSILCRNVLLALGGSKDNGTKDNGTLGVEVMILNMPVVLRER